MNAEYMALSLDMNRDQWWSVIGSENQFIKTTVLLRKNHATTYLIQFIVSVVVAIFK